MPQPLPPYNDSGGAFQATCRRPLFGDSARARDGKTIFFVKDHTEADIWRVTWK